LILASSVTIELARRSLKASLTKPYVKWVVITLVLGFAFLASQLFAWRQLKSWGLYISSNPHSSFFYLLTGVHAAHLAGGLLGLSFLWLRSRQITSDAAFLKKRQASADAVAIYWHFMDALWIYLFLLLFLWR